MYTSYIVKPSHHLPRLAPLLLTQFFIIFRTWRIVQGFWLPKITITYLYPLLVLLCLGSFPYVKGKLLLFQMYILRIYFINLQNNYYKKISNTSYKRKIVLSNNIRQDRIPIFFSKSFNLNLNAPRTPITLTICKLKHVFLIYPISIVMQEDCVSLNSIIINIFYLHFFTICVNF